MKKFTFLFLIIALIASAGMAQQLEGSSGKFTATINKSFDVEAGGSLTVKNVPGDFDVQAWTKGTVAITQKITIKSFTKGEAEEVFKRAQNSFSQSGSKIRIEGDYNGSRVSNDFVINVPETFDVKIGTSGGDIALTGTEGKVDISTSGGDIDVRDTSGRTRATTSGGDLTFTDITGNVAGNTSGGDIDLKNIFGEGNFKTSGGDIELKNATDRINLATSGGSIRVEEVNGDLGAQTSGGNIDIRTVGGSCSVNTSGGDINLNDITGRMSANTSGGDIIGSTFLAPLKVNTSGGDIRLEDVQAKVSGNTSGGDVEVTMTMTDFSQPHGVDLRTSGGHIKLTIPADMPATVDAEIRTSRRNYERRRYDIYSDFPLTKNEPDERGEVVIKARGEINGGGDMVTLQTSGGDIHIQKGK